MKKVKYQTDDALTILYNKYLKIDLDLFLSNLMIEQNEYIFKILTSPCRTIFDIWLAYKGCPEHFKLLEILKDKALLKKLKKFDKISKEIPYIEDTNDWLNTYLYFIYNKRTRSFQLTMKTENLIKEFKEKQEAICLDL